jgi:GNAT superfamily N-acetyltransferase
VPGLAVEEIPLGDPRLDQFVRYPWKQFDGDPFWTPPLRGDLLGNRLLGLTGLLTPAHEYHRRADVTHFLARRDGDPVGRVSAAVNHRYNEYHQCRVAFFGFFDCVDDHDVAASLLDRARAWATERGMSAILGPGEYSTCTHERQGVLIDGFDTPPAVELMHNPPYYAALIEGCGFRKVMDHYGYLIDVTQPIPARVEEIAARVERRRDITVRQISRKDLDADIRLVIEIFNEAWADNWGFLPLTEREAESLADTLRPILDEGLVRFAYVDGEPAAVLGAFPDAYHALRPRRRWYGDSDLVRVARLMRMRRHIPHVRLMFFGVRPRFRRLGVDALLYRDVKRYGEQRGYKTCDISLLLETNHLIIRAAESMGGRRYKTWRVYEAPLEPAGTEEQEAPPATAAAQLT